MAQNMALRIPMTAAFSWEKGQCSWRNPMGDFK